MSIGFKRGSARYDRAHQDRTRQKIADSHVVRDLILFWKGELERKLSKDQLVVGMRLLDKVVPNLQSQELAIDGATPFALIPEQMQDVNEWQEAFTPTVKTEH